MVSFPLSCHTNIEETSSVTNLKFVNLQLLTTAVDPFSSPLDVNINNPFDDLPFP